MNDYTKAILTLSKSCSVIKLTSSGRVSSKPCFVFYINACPDDGAALYEAAVHNGETAAAEVLLDIERQYGQDNPKFFVPMYFNAGIYLALTTNMKSITIQYMEEGR